MRISDWSSDVCSSDLNREDHTGRGRWKAKDIQQRIIHFSQKLDLGLFAPVCAGSPKPKSRFTRWRCLVAESARPVNAAKAINSELDRSVLHCAQPVKRGHRPVECGSPDRKSTRLNSSHQCASSMPSFS